MGVWKQAKALDRLEDRLRTLEVKCEEQGRTTRGLELEFEELFDKVKRMMSRVSKRMALDDKEKLNDVDQDPAISLSDGSDPISRSIMLRRAGYRPPE